jgi:hypothetical protein
MYLSTPSRSRSGPSVPARSWSTRASGTPVLNNFQTPTILTKTFGPSGTPLWMVKHPGSGLGTLSPANQTIASAASSAAAATGVLIGALAAIPIAGPIAAAIAAIGVLLAQVFSGCGQTCVEATDYANETEPLLQQNLSTYLAAPVHYQSMQQAALNNFNLAWDSLVQACGQPQLSTAGTNCVQDRQNGSCAYKTSPGGWQQNNGAWTYVYPGANGSGSTCWNWFVGYHDPIANDPTVVPDPPLTSNSTSTSTTGVETTSTCFSLLSPFGIPDPCIAGIPIGLGTAAAVAILLVVLL